MNSHHIAPGSVQPGQDDDLVADDEPVQGLGGEWLDFEPGIGCAFDTLHWGLASRVEYRADCTDRAKLRRSPTRLPSFIRPPLLRRHLLRAAGFRALFGSLATHSNFLLSHPLRS